MTQTNTTISTAEKIKSFAITLIGAGIFSMGSTYFSEQAEYRIPRILWPIYELLGNVGLAIGMMILGVGLMFYAYKKYAKNNGKSIYILAFSVISVLGFYGIIFSTSSKKTTIEDVRASLEKNQQKTKDKIANTERPELDNDLANNYLDKLEALEQKFEKSVRENNKAYFEECEKVYDSMISTEFGKVATEIGTTPEYRDFAMYNAKILEKIQVFRTHKW